MSRKYLSLPVLLVIPFLLAADQSPVEKQLAIQKAMASARGSLAGGKPAEAVAVLEAEIAKADGNPVFLALLRESYQAELSRLEKSPSADAARVSQLRRHLNLLGATTPSTNPVPVAAPIATPDPMTASTPGSLPAPSFDASAATGSDTVAAAIAEFKKGNYSAAAKQFAAHAANLNDEQKAAWVYCRIKLAADTVGAPKCEPATAAACIAELNDALKLAPNHAQLQKVGQQVIAAATQRAKGMAATPASGDVIETPSFRIRHSGQRELAERVGKTAESLRKEIFERWSGPPAGAWSIRCEIVIHPTAEAFAKASGRPAAVTGNAIVRLTNGQAEERHIDLRADDAAIESNALPRELTHVILADLFPDKPAPKWAVEGMAILAGAPEEAERYTRTLRRCARDGEWLTLAQILELKDFPADKVTAYYCESVALTEFLIRAAGSERNFTVFLRDCHRYGTNQALRRQFNIDSPQALEAALKRAALE